MTQSNQSSWSTLPPSFEAWAKDLIEHQVETKTHWSTSRSRVDLVEEFWQSPEDLQDYALEQLRSWMNVVMEETEAWLTPEMRQEEKEAVAWFYSLMQQIENALPADLQTLYANDFLSPTDLAARQSVERRRNATAQQVTDLEDQQRNITALRSTNEAEVARRAKLQPLQVAQEVITIMIGELQAEIDLFPQELYWLLRSSIRSEAEKEQIARYIEVHEQIIALSDIAAHLRSDPATDAQAYLDRSPYASIVAEWIEVFNAETWALGELINQQAIDLGEIRRNLGAENNKLAAQENQIDSYETVAEPERQRYMDALIAAFLDRLQNDPAAIAAVEAYMYAQNEFYTATQEKVAQVWWLKSLIRKLDSVIHEKNGNIAQKWLSIVTAMWVAWWWSFQTFRWLMNILPKHAHQLPAWIQDALLHADGSPNHQWVLIGSALTGLLVWYISKRWMNKVNKNMENVKKNRVSTMPTKKEMFWTGLSWANRSAMIVVWMMIVMDITGHMATFMGSDKKKLEWKRIEVAKDKLFAAVDEMTAYMREVPAESMANADELLATEAEQWGAGPLYASKKRVVDGTTDWTDIWQFPTAIQRSTEIISTAGGHDGMALEAQMKLEEDLKHLHGMKNISYKWKTVSWLQIPSTVLALWSGVFDLETNMEIQEIVGKFAESVKLYAEALKKIADTYNISIEELENVLAKMEQGTYADRAPLDFEAIDKEELNGKIVKFQAAADHFTAELRKVDPNFDMFDFSATLRFFQEADFGLLWLIERLLLIFWLSLLPVRYMLNQYRLLRNEMKKRNKRLWTLDKEFLELRAQFSGMVQTIAPYLTHLDMQDHLRELFTQIWGTFDETQPMQNQLLSYMEGNLDTTTEAIVRDMFGITGVRDPWFSELTPEDQRNLPRREKKQMKKREQLERAYQDGRIRRINEELKAIIMSHKNEIDVEAWSLITAQSVDDWRRELYTDHFLRHEWHTEGSLISWTVGLMQRSRTFKYLLLDRYNSKDHDPIATPQQTQPTAPVDPFANTAHVAAASAPPPRSWRNWFWLWRGGGNP